MKSGTPSIERSVNPRRRPPAAVPALAAAWVALLVASCGQEDPLLGPGGGNTAQRGKILVTSSVPGAAISLDGVGTGRTTPDTIPDVPAGIHQVRVFLGGYTPNPGTRETNVSPDSLHAVYFDMDVIEGAGAIAVGATYPPGITLDPAVIVVDGVPTGIAAPDTVRGLESGNHRLTLALPGFRGEPEEILVTVLADLVVDADFDVVVRKMVVVEDFSNYGCVPCVPADAALRVAIARFDARQALSMNPHLNFPYAGDPMYTFNRDANGARQYLFRVLTMPAIFANGTRIEEATSADAIQAAIESELAVPSLLAIAVRSTLGATEYAVTVDVWGVESGIPADLFLFTCVVETDVFLDPPGPNGLDEYRNVLRHFFRAPQPPDDTVGGEELGALGAGDRRTFDYVYPLAAGVDPARLAAIAFVQERAGERRVIQIGTSLSP